MRQLGLPLQEQAQGDENAVTSSDVELRSLVN